MSGLDSSNKIIFDRILGESSISIQNLNDFGSSRGKLKLLIPPSGNFACDFEADSNPYTINMTIPVSNQDLTSNVQDPFSHEDVGPNQEIEYNLVAILGNYIRV